jgi:hypothetical protein
MREALVLWQSQFDASASSMLVSFGDSKQHSCLCFSLRLRLRLRFRLRLRLCLRLRLSFWLGLRLRLCEQVLAICGS